MASELDQLRTPSPLPADVLVRLHPQDPSDMRDWLVKISVIVNSTVPVNQLPPELLTEILQILRTDCPRDWSFVAVLLVCRHWYHAAVSSSRLWTKSARGMPLPLVETYLRRSRRAGLSLQVDTQAKCPEDSQDALLNMLFPHFDRVTHLETYSSQPYIKHHMRRLSFLSLHHDFSVHQSSSTIIVHGAPDAGMLMYESLWLAQMDHT
ncbi:uncharacterized protein B0H18DRAFT_1128996 [Fomitopsis serialis]|uniref:uncharacterized protein n=1 Tax=Fomitopsis serialis TaxID=139415 RepID=UPI002007EC94|nr:uncharacterized protein B0H18DRAFT_1128996 [Neoantrodia serialis]KAH9911244.1 hypothetical protein B0H18DRAFT_1128996 [Neoantrodia serialis]